MELVCFKTYIPFGLETNGKSYFIRLKLDESHEKLKEIITNLEMKLDKEKEKVLSIQKLNKFDVLKVKVKCFKNNLHYKINYNGEYLKRLEEITKDDVLDVKFKINKNFTYSFKDKIYTGLSIYLDQIILY